MRDIDKNVFRAIAIGLARLWFHARSTRETFLEVYIYPEDIDVPGVAFKRIRVRIDFDGEASK